MNRIILYMLGYLFIHHIAFTQTPNNDPHWKLDWEDQFNNLNTNRWIIMHNGKHGDEPQLYRENQVWVSNGNLVIEVNNTKVNCPDPAPWPPSGSCGKCVSGKEYNYRSGWVETTSAYNTQFGYIEARIKLPWRRENGKSWGFFPAFWTWQGEGAQYNEAEIDIFEMFGGEYKQPNTLNTCVHRCYPSSDPTCINGDMSRSHTLSNFDYTNWHTYAIEWNANRIIWYVDGKAIRALVNHNIVDPVRIILNLAIQEEKKYLPPTSPAFQEYMYVDYVKVHQLKCDKNTVVNEISNFNTFNYAVKKSITMSNATTIPSGSNISLRATNFIELKPGFEVTTGRELYLDVTPCTDPDCCLDYLTDQTITSNTTVTGCDMLLVQDVEISNSAHVVITAGEEVSIKPGFHAAAGTNVKIGIAP